MKQLSVSEPIDYLVIGHITIDRTPEGICLGGTAAYAGLTAQALGLRVGVVTSWGEEIPLREFTKSSLINLRAAESTQFENSYQECGRTQKITKIANSLTFENIPTAWQSSKILHLGPVAREVDPQIAEKFPKSLLGVTPQGWFRNWDQQGTVRFSEWADADTVLKHTDAVVVSIEDLDYDEERIEEIVASCPVVAVTEAEAGARLYWNGDVRRFRAPKVHEIDPTGAGDIFAAAFFTRLYQTHDPWGAALFATNLSAYSVSRPDLTAIPTAEEINLSMVEVL